MSRRTVNTILAEAYSISRENITETQAVSKLKTIIQEYKTRGFSTPEIINALDKRTIMEEVSSSETLRANEKLDAIINKALGR